MGMSNRTAAPVPGRSQSANEKWKERWSAWVMRSTVAAAAAHAIVFALWPIWNVSYTPSEPLVEMMQIQPVISTGNLTDPDEMSLGAIPEDEEVEIALDEGGSGTEDELSRLSEIFGDAPDPSLALPGGVSAGVYGRPAPPLEGTLLLDHVTAVTPQVVALSPSVVWPRIRNPSMIVRFLRNRYNQLLSDPNANGTVAVTMWINERGSVEWAEVRDSSGHPGLDEIAVSVFSEVVVFSPARSQGSAVPLGVTISVPFTMPW
ncbi:MAG: energy transducer TonB [Gemmatimonadota bacterium]